MIPELIKQRVAELIKHPTFHERMLKPLLSFLCERYKMRPIFQQPIAIGDGSRWIICDWYFPAQHLVIELDGVHHKGDPIQLRRDRERDARLSVELGIETMRFTNEQVGEDVLGVALSIVDRCLEIEGRTRTESAEDLQFEYWDSINKCLCI
jgi:very-short-patch-repair endonuclease